MSTITLPLLLVSIDRGTEVITAKVPEHEIPVLKAVHGPDSISVTEEDTGEEIELDENLDSEWRRLQRKYRRINAPDLVVRAFPIGPHALKPAGFKSVRGGASSEPARAASRVRPPAKKAAETKKSDDGKKAEDAK